MIVSTGNKGVHQLVRKIREHNCVDCIMKTITLYYYAKKYGLIILHLLKNFSNRNYERHILFSRTNKLGFLLIAADQRVDSSIATISATSLREA